MAWPKSSRCSWAAAVLAAAAALSLAGRGAANSTEYWLGRRAAMVRAVFNSSQLPTRDTPDFVEATNTTGLQKLTWDVSSKFLKLNSTTFYYPVVPGKRASCLMVHHHGHATKCDNPPLGCGDRPWDFYNVSDFIHGTLGCDYIMLYAAAHAHSHQEGWLLVHRELHFIHPAAWLRRPARRALLPACALGLFLIAVRQEGTRARRAPARVHLSLARARARPSSPFG